jgi:PBSX family phage terminase large subunit
MDSLTTKKTSATKPIQTGGNASSVKKEEPFRLHPKQKLIFNDPHRFRVVNCGRRFGKTQLAVQELADCLIDHSGDVRIAYIGPTLLQARNIAWNELKKVLEPFTNQVHEALYQIRGFTVDKIRNGNEVELKPNGGEVTVYIFSWEAIHTIRGLFFDFIVVDEVAQMDDFWLHWQEDVLPTLTDRRGRVLFLSTPVGYNHFYDLYQEELKNEDFKSFRFTTYDNPHISAEEVDDLKKSMTPDRFAQEYMAEFRKMVGLVYPEFIREKHIVTEFPAEMKEIICGVDFGYNAPACVLKIGVDSDNNYWVTDEWYKPGKTGAQIAEITAMYRPNLVYPDPAEPDKVEDLRSVGLNVRETNKDIKNGIDRVRDLILQGRVRIAGHCKNLIMELETYRYPDAKDDRSPTERPIKNNDHAVDALRYALYTHTPADNSFQEYGVYQTEYV